MDPLIPWLSLTDSVGHPQLLLIIHTCNSLWRMSFVCWGSFAYQHMQKTGNVWKFHQILLAFQLWYPETILTSVEVCKFKSCALRHDKLWDITYTPRCPIGSGPGWDFPWKHAMFLKFTFFLCPASPTLPLGYTISIPLNKSLVPKPCLCLHLRNWH